MVGGGHGWGQVTDVVLDGLILGLGWVGGGWGRYIVVSRQRRGWLLCCEGDDDGVDSRDDGVEMGRGGEVAVVERALFTCQTTVCMHTHSQSRNLHHQQHQAPSHVVEPFNLEEPIENPAPPLAPMDDTRTMAQLLEAPTAGYEDAIVVPEITANNFELKHGLLNLVQNKQFFGHDKEDPHAHIRYFNKITSTMKFVPNGRVVAWRWWDKLLGYKMPRDCLRIIESKSKVHNSRNKPVVAEVTSSTFTLGISFDVAELKDMVVQHPAYQAPDYQAPAPQILRCIKEDFPSSTLKNEEKAALIEVLKSHKRAIAWKLSDIKGIDPEFCTHKILMEEDYEPTVQHQRRVNPKIHDVIKKEVEKLLDAGLIYPISDSPWVSPVHCVPKKGGMTVVKNDENDLIPTRLVTGWRVCIDYRKLNEATRKDHFPLPFMDQMLERLAGNQYYCFLDGFSGYFQIPIDPKDQEKTTFTCPYGTFAYRRMPFGLCNAPGTFQRCMMAIFHDMIEKTMEVFMDDFSVFGDSFSTCLSHLDKMLKRCEDTNLVLNWEKSHFMVKEGIVLGHKISKSGIEVDRAKVDVIAKLPHPTTVKGVRSFLGHAGFYRRFIQDFSKIARPMTHLLEKETPFFFSKECIESFNTLKRKLTEAPILIAPDWDLPFELMCDASDFAIGAVLGQRKNKHFLHYVARP
ncbi:reverse transcriptase domain-containing protein [Tanacetum coccineum]